MTCDWVIPVHVVQDLVSIFVKRPSGARHCTRWTICRRFEKNCILSVSICRVSCNLQLISAFTSYPSPQATTDICSSFKAGLYASRRMCPQRLHLALARSSAEPIHIAEARNEPKGCAIWVHTFKTQLLYRPRQLCLMLYKVTVLSSVTTRLDHLGLVARHHGWRSNAGEIQKASCSRLSVKPGRLSSTPLSTKKRLKGAAAL